jgi:hypothetical protein
MTEAPTSMGFENEISLQTNLKKKAIENGEKIQPNTAASCSRERERVAEIDCSAHLKRIKTVESVHRTSSRKCL